MKVNAEAPRKASWVKVVVIGRNPKRTLARIVFLALSSFLIFKFVLLPIRVQGGSMLPTYRENGVNVINRLAYVWSQPKRGDVIGIRLAGPSIMYMKRIVGLPGEKRKPSKAGGALVTLPAIFTLPRKRSRPRP